MSHSERGATERLERWIRTGRPGGPATPREHKFNVNHDPDNGRFTFASAGGLTSSQGQPTSGHSVARGKTERLGDPPHKEESIRDPVRRKPAEMRISANGARLIQGSEGFRATPYRPVGARSGVTIGHGYDMGSRTSRQIVDDLTASGVSTADAHALASAAGLKGTAADRFIDQSLRPVRVTEEQSLKLYSRTISAYENIVKQVIHVPLTQNQFDALTSLAYNAPIAFVKHSTLVRKLNAGDIRGAADEIITFRKVTNKEGQKVVSPGAEKRRAIERSLFLKP